MSKLSRHAIALFAMVASLLTGPWRWHNKRALEPHPYPCATEARSEFNPTARMEGGQPVRPEQLVLELRGVGSNLTVVFNHRSTGLDNVPELFRISWSSAELTH